MILLQELALAMQADAADRQRQVPNRWGAERIAAKVMEIADEPAAVTPESSARAERFLDQEEVDSGIIVAAAKR